MWYEIEPRGAEPFGYLQADLYGRETAAETRSFLKAVGTESLRRGCTRLLIHVHTSRPIFKVEQYGLSAYLAELATRPAYRVALVGGGNGVHAAHEYIAELAQQRGVAVRAFVDRP